MGKTYRDKPDNYQKGNKKQNKKPSSTKNKSYKDVYKKKWDIETGDYIE